MEGFNGFPFSNSSSSSFSSGSSSSANNNPTNDEATTKKIVEAVELLEKLANKGEFPLEKLQEIKQELKKKYPNINFSPQNDSQKLPGNANNHSPNSSTLPNNSFPNDPFFASNFINQLNQQQQLNNAIFQQTQMINNQFIEQNMRMLGVPWTRTTYNTSAYSAPSNNNPYFGVTFPTYHNTTTPSMNYGQMSGDPMKMVLEMMGNINNQETASNAAAFTTSPAFGGDDSGATAIALSFLGSLLGGTGL